MQHAALIAAVGGTAVAAVGIREGSVLCRVKEQILGIVMGVGRNIIALAVLGAGLCVIGMQVFFAAAFRIPEVDQTEAMIRIQGDGHHHQLIAVALFHTLPYFYRAVLLRCGAEEQIIQLFFRVIDHLRGPDLLPGRPAHLRKSAGNGIVHIVQGIAHRLPVHQVLGPVAENRAFRAVQIVIAVPGGIVQHERIGTIGLLIIAVIQFLVKVRPCLTLLHDALIIRHLIMLLGSFAACQQGAGKQHQQCQKQAHASNRFHRRHLRLIL